MYRRMPHFFIKLVVMSAVSLSLSVSNVPQVKAAVPFPTQTLNHPQASAANPFTREPPPSPTSTPFTSLADRVSAQLPQTPNTPNDCVKPAVPIQYTPTNNSTISDTRPFFDWSDVANATNYHIAIQDMNDAYNYIFVQTDSSNYTPDVDLVDSDYEWLVFATNGSPGCSVNSDLSPTWFFTLDTNPVCVTPGIPQLIAPSNNSTVTDSRPHFDWNDVADATEYHILIQDMVDPYNFTFEQTTTSQFTPSSDLVDSDYEWIVYATHVSDGCTTNGDFSATWYFTLDTTPPCVKPSVPQLISPPNGSVMSDKRPFFDWNDVSNATEYHIAIQDKNDAYNYIFEKTTISEYRPSTDLVDSDYEWLVFASNTASGCNVNGDSSATWAFTLNAVPPPIPNLVSPANGSTLSDNTPTFTWLESVGTEQYHLEADNNANFSSPEVNVAPSTTSFTPGSSLADGTYYWRVRAGDHYGSWSNWSTVWSFTIDTTPVCEKPGIPQLIAPANSSTLTNPRPQFDWNDVANATVYHIAIQDDHDAYNYVLDTTTTSDYRPSTDLAPSDYKWLVYATNTTGTCGVNGDLSVAWAFTINTTSVPPAPTLNPISNPEWDGTYTVSWSSVSTATGYELQERFNNGSWAAYSLTGTSKSFSGKADGQWCYQVRGTNTAGTGNWSNLACTIVDTTPPASPTLLSPSNASTIDDNTPTFDWSDPTDASGYRLQVDDLSNFSSPQINVTPSISTYTSSSPLPDGDYFWRVQAQDWAGNWSNWSSILRFTVKTSTPPLVDMGFRPDPDGYHFINYGGVNYDDFTIDDMRAMFGDDAVCNMVGSACQPLSAALEWNRVVNEWMNGGHCLGFTITSLRFFTGLDDPGDFQSGAVHTYDLELSSARRHIAYYWVLQLVNPMGAAIDQARQLTMAQNLDRLVSALSGGTPDPVDMDIWDWGGHSIAPYAIEDKGNGLYWVRVYNNNNPNDSSQYVVIDTANDTWSYGGWSGTSYNRSMAIVPISVYAQPAVCPWCSSTSSQKSGATDAPLWLYSQDLLLITDAQGRHLGYVGDEYVSQIPGAYGTTPVGGLGIPMEPVYSLPQSGSYTITLSGTTLARAENATVPQTKVSQFGPGYAVTLEDLSLTSASEDVLSIASDGTQVSYQAEHAVEPTLKMGVVSSSNDQAFEIRGADIGDGQELALSVNASDQQLIVDNSRTSGGSFDLHITKQDAAGTHTFNHPDISVAAADTQVVDYSSFETSNTVTVAVDHGSDGTIDEMVTLDNQIYNTYLPFLTRK